MASNAQHADARMIDAADLTDEQFALVLRYIRLVRAHDLAQDAALAFRRLLDARQPAPQFLTEEAADQLAEDAVAWARRKA